MPAKLVTYNSQNYPSTLGSGLMGPALCSHFVNKYSGKLNKYLDFSKSLKTDWYGPIGHLVSVTK